MAMLHFVVCLILGMIAGGRTSVAPAEADIGRLVLTPAEVAEALGCDLNELYARLRSGTAPFPVRRLGRRWIIPRAAFLRWLEEQPVADPTADASSAA